MKTAQGIPRSRHVLAHIGLFYAAAIWGSTFFIVKDALNDVDPVIMVGYRFLLAGLLLLGYLAVTGRPILQNVRQGAGLAVLLWLLYVPQTIGLGITTASNSGFITGMFVAFVPIFLRLIFKRRPTILEVIASAISLVGLWILTGGMKNVNLGDGLTLITAMFYALHLLYSDKYMKAGYDPLIISCQQFLLIGLFSLLVGGAAGLSFNIGSTKTVGIIVFLALFPTLSAFIIQMLAQKIAAPLQVSLIFALEPVFAALFAWTLGGEHFTTRGALGGGFVFVALILSALPVHRLRQWIFPT